MTYEVMHSAQAQSVRVKEKISFGFVGQHCRDIISVSKDKTCLGVRSCLLDIFKHWLLQDCTCNKNHNQQAKRKVIFHYLGQGIVDTKCLNKTKCSNLLIRKR